MASEDNVIVVRGVGTHASRPWDGIGPITIAAHMPTELQTIVSPQRFFQQPWCRRHHQMG